VLTMFIMFNGSPKEVGDYHPPPQDVSRGFLGIASVYLSDIYTYFGADMCSHMNLYFNK